MVVCSLVFAFACVAAALAVAGVIVLLFSPFAIIGGGFLKVLLTGMGLSSAGVSLGALMTLAGVGLINFLIQYGRLHMRLIKPITA